MNQWVGERVTEVSIFENNDLFKIEVKLTIELNQQSRVFVGVILLQIVCSVLLLILLLKIYRF